MADWCLEATPKWYKKKRCLDVVIYENRKNMFVITFHFINLYL